MQQSAAPAGGKSQISAKRRKADNPSGSDKENGHGTSDNSHLQGNMIRRDGDGDGDDNQEDDDGDDDEEEDDNDVEEEEEEEEEDDDDDDEDDDEDDNGRESAPKKSQNVNKPQKISWLNNETEKFLNICKEKHVVQKIDGTMGQHLTRAKIFKVVAKALKDANVSKVEKTYVHCKKNMGH
ncbi:phosphopantothenoylcysteine decarboxylase subunit VHS3-like isoform X1 [Thrips palmi]|uniref:Phosphopantothenoylcysteine decarboxylase subunit VHS3-like isoform X1 n=1 Tax=Thrips palmi TaxID=161013 RepID=A0A6P8Z613_THRPL|nr:phosphopantothenoylcysteine decarboxylase subunit VHS3-like isoform X1 [Thrips palmi]